MEEGPAVVEAGRMECRGRDWEWVYWWEGIVGCLIISPPWWLIWLGRSL